MSQPAPHDLLPAAFTGQFPVPAADATPLVSPEPETFPELTPLEERFVEAKIAGHSNPEALAIAGQTRWAYVTRRARGAALMRDERIQRAIRIREQELLADLRVSAAHVKAELAAVAFSSLEHYQIDDDGHVQLTEHAPEHARRAIAAVKRRVRYVPRGKDEEPEKIVETELKLWDKNTALRSLGQSLEMFRDGGAGGGNLTLIFDMAGRGAAP